VKIAAGIVAAYVLVAWLTGEGAKPSPASFKPFPLVQQETDDDCHCLIPPNYGLYR